MWGTPALDAKTVSCNKSKPPSSVLLGTEVSEKKWICHCFPAAASAFQFPGSLERWLTQQFMEFHPSCLLRPHYLHRLNGGGIEGKQVRASIPQGRDQKHL